MKYKKIRLNFKKCQDNRFYRTLLVKEDLNLFNLGCAIVTAFGGSFEHHFLFRTNDVNYCPKVYINSLNGTTNVLMDKYMVSNLSNKFTFLYDMKSTTEYEANMFAADFLVDDETIEDFAEQDFDYYTMCGLLQISPEMTAFKLYNMIQRGYKYNLPQSVRANIFA